MRLNPLNHVRSGDPPLGREPKQRQLGARLLEPRLELGVGEGVVVLYGVARDAEDQEGEGRDEAGAVLAEGAVGEGGELGWFGEDAEGLWCCQLAALVRGLVVGRGRGGPGEGWGVVYGCDVGAGLVHGVEARDDQTPRVHDLARDDANRLVAPSADVQEDDTARDSQSVTRDGGRRYRGDHVNAHVAPPGQLAEEELLKVVPRDGDVKVVLRLEAGGRGVGGRTALAALLGRVELLGPRRVLDQQGTHQ